MEDYLKNLPFLTVVKYLDVEYVGIVGDSDNSITSFYPFNENMTMELKKKYVELGLYWWWETNRKLPISVSLLKEWKPFSQYTLNFITKDLEYIMGRELPSIEKLMLKKTKRKQIQLHRKI